MIFPKRGEIHLVEFDPARGSEIQKTRPAVVIQNDIGNLHSPIVIVAAISSKLSATPFPVEVTVSPTKGNGLAVKSAIQLNQIRSIDKLRLIRKLGELDSASMAKVDVAIGISLGLTSV
jgi:mRNA interferase MazF